MLKKFVHILNIEHYVYLHFKNIGVIPIKAVTGIDDLFYGHTERIQW